MAMFVHLAFEGNIKSILRNGISRLRKHSEMPDGLYAMPVTKNFYISHQWLRELKRTKRQTICGVYFRLKDDEQVWVGHYNQNHQELSAAQSVALISSTTESEGYEVIVPRKIKKSEIHSIKQLPQIVGWRYFPQSHGKKPCGCEFCQRGNYGAKRLRTEFERQEQERTQFYNERL